MPGQGVLPQIPSPAAEDAGIELCLRMGFSSRPGSLAPAPFLRCIKADSAGGVGWNR